MRLYIAEKPSMAREIAACLKKPAENKNGFIVTSEGTVTWLYGHILRQAEPEEYDEKFKMWRAELLPIVPDKWKLIVDEKCRSQFAIVKNLIERADEIIHAGDPDREGQLLVDEVLDFVGNKKPVKRILLNALDEKSIKKANENLRDNEEFFNLKQSALARSRADWLIGMNLSRAYTLAARRAGHSRIVLPIGRVKTPTLALVVRREREIENFSPVDHYGITATFRHENGSFAAVWKPNENERGLDREGRLTDRSVADGKLEFFSAAPDEAIIKSYQKAKKQEGPPLPFSLSTLQLAAGKSFGYDPQFVLDTAQKLYEKKLTTYPRSDCEYLPTNQFSDAKKIIGNLAAGDDAYLSRWAAAADTKKKSRAWNDKKITAHHAIIPTAVPAKLAAMPDAERNIYRLVARAFIAQFYGAHVFDQTKVEVAFKDEIFSAGGRTEREAGWKSLYPTKKKNDGEDAEDTLLPPMKKKDAAFFLSGAITKKTTKPPVRFTPATLLAGMKEIHKYVKNEEAKKQLKDVYGIGTEATRANIIDDLIRRKFIKADGKKKYLVPQPSAYLLIDALPDEMTYPDSTAVWEDRLHSMAEGDGTLDDFIAAQINFAKTLCEKAYAAKIATAGEQHACPRCKNGVLTKRHGKNGDFWGCTNYPRCRMTCDDKNGAPDLKNSFAKNSFAAKKTTVAAPPPKKYAPEKTYLCPKCREGRLRRVERAGGAFWGCSNYPDCNATFADEKNAPRIIA